jgi:hypothetical protein
LARWDLSWLTTFFASSDGGVSLSALTTQAVLSTNDTNVEATGLSGKKVAGSPCGHPRPRSSEVDSASTVAVTLRYMYGVSTSV